MAPLISGRRWNLFARELEAILQDHGFSLGHLTTRLGIHTEKVRRLKQSLTSRTFLFHLLNPQELEEITLTFQFTGEEQLRLRAALLATAIEELLMNRINPESALEAAEEVFPILLSALRRRLGRQHGIAATRREPLINDRTLDELFEPILELLNHALLALYLGQVGSPPQRLEQSRNALKGFLAVQEDLEALSKQNADLLTNTTWLLWQKETQDGLAQARQQVEQLET